MENLQPYILVTNDDGIDSPGICALAAAMKLLGEVVVIAPDRQQSAVGHSLTVAEPLRIAKVRHNGSFFGYSVNGTPSDCVKIGLSTILDKKPDLLVSGINHGQNTSINVLYSGTVSAATEGALVGINSLAISLDSHSHNVDCSVAALITQEIVKKLTINQLPKGTLLNINIPNLPQNQIKGIKIASISKNIWADSYEKRSDPFGREYYWFCGDFSNDDNSEGSDFVALQRGWVTVSPIKYEFTDYGLLDKLKFLE
ncbi:MAG: 5'/3'-nucleotidase SurE [Candidatus Kapabacteria bacterium]|nr:5'/3'-nucleotidase SurE [Candidatus Kapabacteria bacterium]